MFRPARSASSLVPILLLLAGCGGGGGASSARVTPKITIVWPARNRDVSAPGSAGAVSIVLTTSDPLHGTNFFSAERPSGDAASAQTYSFPTPVKPGHYGLVLEFYVGLNAGRVLVASADVDVNVGRDGTLRDRKGNPITAAVLQGQVASVAIQPDPTVDLGTSLALPVSATTKDGSLFAVPTGAVTFRVASGSALTVNADGSVTGKVEGEATVVANVDGVDSAPQTVRVVVPTIASRLIGPVPRGLVVDPVRGRLLVSSSDASGGVVDEIDPASGTVTRSFAVGDAPDALGLADDASTLYVGLPQAGTILPLDLGTGSLGTPIILPENAYGGGYHAVELAVRPGHPATVVANLQFDDQGYDRALETFDAGVPRPGFGGYSQTELVTWVSPTLLFFQNLGSPSRLTGVTIDSGAPTGGTGPSPLLFPYNTDFAFSEGRLYASNHDVLDATSLKLVGHFDALPGTAAAVNTFGPAIDARAKLAYFIVKDSDVVRLIVYRTDDFSLYAVRRVADFPVEAYPVPSGGGRLLRWGARGLALATPKGTLLIDDAPGL